MESSKLNLAARATHLNGARLRRPMSWRAKVALAGATAPVVLLVVAEPAAGQPDDPIGSPADSEFRAGGSGDAGSGDDDGRPFKLEHQPGRNGLDVAVTSESGKGRMRAATANGAITQFDKFTPNDERFERSSTITSNETHMDILTKRPSGGLDEYLVMNVGGIGTSLLVGATDQEHVSADLSGNVSLRVISHGHHAGADTKQETQLNAGPTGVSRLESSEAVSVDGYKSAVTDIVRGDPQNGRIIVTKDVETEVPLGKNGEGRQQRLGDYRDGTTLVFDGRNLLARIDTSFQGNTDLDFMVEGFRRPPSPPRFENMVPLAGTGTVSMTINDSHTVRDVLARHLFRIDPQVVREITFIESKKPGNVEARVSHKVGGNVTESYVVEVAAALDTARMVMRDSADNLAGLIQSEPGSAAIRVGEVGAELGDFSVFGSGDTGVGRNSGFASAVSVRATKTKSDTGEIETVLDINKEAQHGAGTSKRMLKLDTATGQRSLTVVEDLPEANHRNMTASVAGPAEASLTSESAEIILGVSKTASLKTGFKSDRPDTFTMDSIEHVGPSGLTTSMDRSEIEQ